MSEQRKTTMLIILDGWGYREEREHNAIANASTPFWDALLERCPNTLLHTSGEHVGLPDGQMGNSEVGHMNLGAGRVLYQSLTRIDKDIREGRFADNPAISKLIDGAARDGRALHVMGLLSPGGVHSHEDQILAACQAAIERGVKHIYLHAFLDGRDTPPRSAGPSLEKADALLRNKGVGRVASVIGRYYAMDRDERWDRVEQAWTLLTRGKGLYQAANASEALSAAYARDENDEFVQATWIPGATADEGIIASGDRVLFMNFRADRARQLTRVFVEPSFTGFDRGLVPELGGFVMLTEYAADIDTDCAYPPETIRNGLGEYLSSQGLKQLRIAETEKYAHVTFFFSGGREACFPLEERLLVPSPRVATYDLQPEMSAPEVSRKLVDAIAGHRYDFIVVNFANGDMVGHTGVYSAAMAAAEAIDAALAEVVSALEQHGGQCLITADHGNAEQMVDDQGRAHTQHTTGPVPLVYVGPRRVKLAADGVLADIAPSLLALMEMPVPAEMSGRSLIETATT